MASLEILTPADVRRIAREEAARPALVSQRSVAAVVGLDGREFLRLARAGAFPVTKERRLVLAKTPDVVGYFESRMRSQAPADGGDELAAALARVGSEARPC